MSDDTQALIERATHHLSSSGIDEPLQPRDIRWFDGATVLIRDLRDALAAQKDAEAKAEREWDAHIESIDSFDTPELRAEIAAADEALPHEKAVAQRNRWIGVAFKALLRDETKIHKTEKIWERT